VSTDYIAPEPYVRDHPRAIAMYCSDGRFTGAVESLLHALGHDRLDTLTMPGGPALLVPSIAQVAEHQAVRRAASFLVRGHALTHAVLLAHEGCGFYRQRLPRETPDAVRHRQLADLASAASELRRELPGLDVRLFYASVVDGKIGFAAVRP
jgi:hypothetical protein